MEIVAITYQLSTRLVFQIHLHFLKRISTRNKRKFPGEIKEKLGWSKNAQLAYVYRG